jgi:hypothetical protein
MSERAGISGCVEPDETAKLLILRQEEAITELNARIRARDAIMEAAIQEAAALHHSLNEMYLRMLRARFTRP